MQFDAIKLFDIFLKNSDDWIFLNDGWKINEVNFMGIIELRFFHYDKFQARVEVQEIADSYSIDIRYTEKLTDSDALELFKLGQWIKTTMEGE